MDIKYCKNCANFSPVFNKKDLEPGENFSWGYCRLITKLVFKNNRIEIITTGQQEAPIDKVVAVNQPVVVDRDRICPAFSNLADLFFPEKYRPEVSNIDILSKLNYVKCKNCFHIFASPEDKLQNENRYVCPICFHEDEYLLKEHFKRKPVFLDKNLADF
jgi:hypothetical protein